MGTTGPASQWEPTGNVRNWYAGPVGESQRRSESSRALAFTGVSSTGPSNGERAPFQSCDGVVR